MLSSPCFLHPPTQRVTQNTSESKKKRPGCAVNSRCGSTALTSSYFLQPSSHPGDRPQSTARFLQSPGTAEEECQQHISVIQAIGLAASNGALAQSYRKTSPLLPGNSLKPMSFPDSPKQLALSTSPKHSSHSSSPKHSSVTSSPKPLDLCSPSKPTSLSSSPTPAPHSLFSLQKTPNLLISQLPSRKRRFLMPSSKHTQPVDSIKESSGNILDNSSSHMKCLKVKQVSYFIGLHWC